METTRVEAQTQTQGGEPLAGTSEAPKLLGKGELEWGPSPDVFPSGCQFCVLHGDPGAAAMFTVRLKVGNRYVFAPHSHPHDEHLTILSGRLELGNGRTADRGAVRAMDPGDYAFLPRDQFHYAYAAADDTVFQVQAIGPFGITYANPEDDPRGQTKH
ncbi:MAG TPA: cupin domain-containing protein [Anaeromyxobacteraceae bacterium]|nr:cupin domain-containing protein [Anaeromyxobacteraceae bacterium]